MSWLSGDRWLWLTAGLIPLLFLAAGLYCWIAAANALHKGHIKPGIFHDDYSRKDMPFRFHVAVVSYGVGAVFFLGGGLAYLVGVLFDL